LEFSGDYDMFTPSAVADENSAKFYYMLRHIEPGFKQISPTGNLPDNLGEAVDLSSVCTGDCDSVTPRHCATACAATAGCKFKNFADFFFSKKTREIFLRHVGRVRVLLILIAEPEYD
jgi:hypothetical protein